jgi:diacylglycerol kinase family enzyme
VLSKESTCSAELWHFEDLPCTARAMVGRVTNPGVEAPNEIADGHTVPPDAPLFIVLNVASGKHDSVAIRATIEAALVESGRRFTLLEVSEPGLLPQVARDAVAQARGCSGIVVAAGGDGTIASVAQATLGSGCFFGVLPLGTFNYFSRSHGIPSELPEACRILLGARAFAVQVGLVNDRVFLVNSSIGLYPKLLEEREQAKQQLGRSRLVAFVAALKTLFTSHQQLRLEIDSKHGRRSIAARTLFVGNNRLQLERVGIPESKELDRHRLAAVVLRPVSVLRMSWLVLRAILGRLGDADEVLSFDFERIVVRRRFGRRPFKVATDGEVEWLAAPLTFSVLPHALLLLRPAERREDPG